MRGAARAARKREVYERQQRVEQIIQMHEQRHARAYLWQANARQRWRGGAVRQLNSIVREVKRRRALCLDQGVDVLAKLSVHLRRPGCKPREHRLDRHVVAQLVARSLSGGPVTRGSSSATRQLVLRRLEYDIMRRAARPAQCPPVLPSREYHKQCFATPRTVATPLLNLTFSPWNSPNAEQASADVSTSMGVP